MESEVHVQSDGLASQRLHEDLYGATTKAEHQVQSGLLDVVVCQRAAILELLASKDQALLVRRNAFLVLNLLLHVFDGVRGVHVQSDGFASSEITIHLAHFF